MTWQDHAACRSSDPELFFPVTDLAQQTREAKRVCRSCDVRGECLTWALARETFGVWGGTTENERRTLRRHRIAAAGAPR